MRNRDSKLIVVFAVCLGMLAMAGRDALAQTQNAPPAPTRAQADPPPKPPTAQRSPAPNAPLNKPQAKPNTPPAKPPPTINPQGPRKPVAPAKPAEKPPEAAAPVVVPAPIKPADGEKPEPDKRKLPRFAALRSDEVNMRVGPGTRYPIEWQYKRRDLPVEIEREFEVWRLVRDVDGIRGWVHQATLVGRRNFIVNVAEATLRNEAKDLSASVAVLKSGVIGRLRSCEAASDWCEVQVAGHRGYLKRDQFWGLLPKETIAP